MDLNLNYQYDPAKDDFYLTTGEPKLHAFGWYKFIKVLFWTNMQKKDGSAAWFCGLVFFNKLRVYFCTAKIDGTRTLQYWNGELGGTPDQIDKNKYVANASVPGPKWPHLRTEHWAVRFTDSKHDGERWGNQGGI